MTQGPAIDLWQPAHRVVDIAAHPQRWVNVLGRVQGRIVRLTSSLDNAAPRQHWTGPDLRRLTGAGDFNIELPLADLHPGPNHLTLTATDPTGAQATTRVTFDCRTGAAPQVPHLVDWSDPATFTVVDGAWSVTAQGIRIAEPGYDRMLAFGARDGRGYDLRTSVTFHAAAAPLARAPTFGVAHVALAARWPGHGADMHQPHLAWHPLGVTCEWQVDPSLRGCRFRMLFGPDTPVEEPGPGRDLLFGRIYALRLRCEPVPDGTRYAIRGWPADASEPDDWALTAVKSPEDTPAGAAALLAHNTDVTFGPTHLDPLPDPRADT